MNKNHKLNKKLADISMRNMKMPSIELLVRNSICPAKLIGKSRVLLIVSKDEVRNNDLTRSKLQLDELRKAKASAKGCFSFMFSGYDDDIREIYEVPEIRNYFKSLLQEYPELLYYIDSFSEKTFMLCFLDIIYSQKVDRETENWIMLTDKNRNIRHKILAGKLEYERNMDSSR